MRGDAYGHRAVLLAKVGPLCQASQTDVCVVSGQDREDFRIIVGNPNPQFNPEFVGKQSGQLVIVAGVLFPILVIDRRRNPGDDVQNAFFPDFLQRCGLRAACGEENSQYNAQLRTTASESADKS